MWVPELQPVPSGGLSSPRAEAVSFLARGGTKKQTAGCAIATKTSKTFESEEEAKAFATAGPSLSNRGREIRRSR
jgi:hypothetical protein